MINKINSIVNKFNEFKLQHQYELFFAIIIFSILVIIVINYITSEPDDEINNLYTGLPFTKSKRPIAILKKNKCKKSHEKKCREIVEKLFNSPFPSIRPYFLKNKFTNKNLELDMYNLDLNLAIEYSGIQHSKYTPYFHKSYTDFLLQKERDDMKKQMCRERKITLIVIPHTVKFDDLERYIIKQLRIHGYDV